jgi:phage gp45-like
MGLTRDGLRHVEGLLARVQVRLSMLVRKGNLTAVDATGTSTRVGVKMPGDEAHESVELLEPYGFTSNPPAGSKVLLVCSGGDGGHPMALLAGDPGTRLSGLGSGDVAIHVGAGAGGGTGARIVWRANGTIEINPGPAAVASVVPSGAVGPLPVARATDPVAVTSPALLTLQDAFNAWVPVANDGGAALKTALATFLGLDEAVVVQGTGTITAGGTGMVST